MKKIAIAFTGMLFSGSLFAQSLVPCISYEHLQEQKANDPSIFAREADLELFTRDFANRPKNSQAPLVIPVVFHVLHEYGTENISRAQILDQLRTLNEDYNRQNPDTVNTPAPFKPLSGGLNVVFRLATKDPNGNCTDGINRLYTPLTNNARDNVKSLIYWPRNQYLNVWVVKTIENTSGSAGTVLGYAQFPFSGPASTDGLVVRSDYIGSIGTSNDGRTLTHEVGHWLNLRHIWGDATCGNDQVNDTPEAAGANSGCPPFPHLSTSCAQDANGDMFTNYMDYTNGTCMNQFSVGQCSRMQACLNSSTGQRNSLWTTSNLTATGTITDTTVACAPVSDFTPYLPQFICAGGSVVFTDKSYRSTVTSYSWSFPGGTPATSSDANPVVTYNTPGTYEATLTVSNANGSNTSTRAALIRVLPNTAQVQDTLFQTFTGITLPDQGWEVINRVTGTPAFATNTSAGFGSGSCVWLNNAVESNLGSIDELLSPTYNLSVIDSPFISFRYAYAQKTASSASQNRLQVYISNDCGKSWLLRYNVVGNSLASATATNSSFIPTQQSQWKNITIPNITAFTSAENLRVRFMFTSGGDGNNFFLDNFRVSGRNTFAGIGSAPSLFPAVVYPNPAHNKLFVDAPYRITKYECYDFCGRMIAGAAVLSASPVVVPLEGFSAGLYVLKLFSAEGAEQVKIRVE